MIIDALTHLTPDGRWFNTPHDASAARLLREMDEAAVLRAAVVGIPGYISNDFVISVCRAHSDRLLPVASFDPSAYSSTKEVRSAAGEILSNASYIGIKLHPRINQYDLSDPRCTAFFEAVADAPRSLPVWLCTYLYDGHLRRGSVVGSLYDLVVQFSRVPFILVHGGGPDILSLAHAVRGCANSVLDLSFTISRYAGSSVDLDITYLMNRFERRLVFGSDFPEIGIGDAIADFRRYAATSQPSAAASVLGANLRHFLDQNGVRI